MATIAETFATALALHQAGHLRQAEQLYRAIVQADPRHADGYHRLGILAHQEGRFDDAANAFQRAVALNPSAAHYHFNLGVIYEALNRPADALASYQQADLLQPGDADCQNRLAIALSNLGRLDEAEAHARGAVRLRPDVADAHNTLGDILQRKGSLAEAEGSYREALRLNPAYADAHTNLGSVLLERGRLDEAVASSREALRLRPAFPEALVNLGNALSARGDRDEAVAAFRQALRLRPNYPEAYNNLGNALKDRGDLEEAIDCYHQALRLWPEYPEAYNNLGGALAAQGRVDEAAEFLRTALRLRPDWPPALNNWGVVLCRQGHYDEALAHFRTALRMQPNFTDAHTNSATALGKLGALDEALAHCDEALRLAAQNAGAHYNRALLWLQRGDFARGWPEHEWRWPALGFPRPDFPQPRWDGADLDRKTILLYAEQGLGDTIQFARYAPLVQERGGRVVLQCQPSLVGVLATCPGIDQVLPQGTPLPDFDVQTPLLSLPWIFGTALQTISARVPYLAADPQLVERWRKELERYPGFRVGITWQGDPVHHDDRHRSVALARFAPLADVEGVRLVSLQVGRGTEQLAETGGGLGILDLGSRFDRSSFADAAAVMMGLDLVVTVDTAIAHLAGALGVPVWVALAFSPDWRWLLDREDSPWYPSMRLFRQRQVGDWDDVFARITEVLRQCRDGHRA